MKIIEFEVDVNRLLTGMAQLANFSRINVYQENEDIFEALDFDDERVFLEPALIYNRTENHKGVCGLPIEQLLWGALAEKERPSRLEVQTCAEGWLKMPNWGYFKTELSSTMMNLNWHSPGILPTLTLGSELLPATFYPEVVLPNSSIRITRNRPNLYRDLGAHLNEDVSITYNKWAPFLVKAFGIMQEVVPEYCKLIELSTKEISLFSSDNQNSFASMAHFGTCFINVDDPDYDEVFFVDDIAHQCGHTILYAITLTSSELFVLAPDTPLVTLGNNTVAGEHRSLYEAFHGLFTYTTAVHCLDQSLQLGLFKGKQIREAIGRIGFYMRKFNYDLRQLSMAGLFAAQGLVYYNMFKSSYNLMLNKYRMLPPVDYSTQPYTFNLKIFIAENPNYESLNEKALLAYGLLL